MALIIPACVLLILWIVLNHSRKQHIERDYIELRRIAIEKGVNMPQSEGPFASSNAKESSLRVAVIALAIGVAFLIIPLVGLTSPGSGEREFFVGLAILTLAFGSANLLLWFVLDRSRRGKSSTEEK